MAFRLFDSHSSENNWKVCARPGANNADQKCEDLARWTIIIPFLNEAQFIERTLESVAAQSAPLQLVLVDNGSTDDGAAIALVACRRLGIDYRLVREPRRGKVRALAAGFAEVSTPFVATFDADTYYPEFYLEAGERLLEGPNCAAAQAYYAYPNWSAWRRRAASLRLAVASRLLRGQCHNGGAGQVFRIEPLRRAGGFDPRRWSHILEDHEIIHRVSALGTIDCANAFWCAPARRERDQPSSRWSLLERVAYHLTPRRLQSRYFYEFLAPRLEDRHGSVPVVRRRNREAKLARCAD